MWLNHDASWWGLALAILALLLMLPANLLANFITPMLKNWWAERSAASISKRIEELEKQLRENESHPKLTEAEANILMALETLAGLVMTGMLTPLVILLYSAPVTHSRRFYALISLMLLTVVSGVIVGAVIFQRLTTFRETRTPSNHDEMRKSVDQLRKKLGQKKLA